MPEPTTTTAADSKTMFGWLKTEVPLWAVLSAIASLTLSIILWALGVADMARDAQRVNSTQDKRLEAVESAVKTLALQGYQQEVMSRQINEMSGALKEMQRVPATLEVLNFRMGNVETAVGATGPRRPQK